MQGSQSWLWVSFWEDSLAYLCENSRMSKRGVLLGRQVVAVRFGVFLAGQ